MDQLIPFIIAYKYEILFPLAIIEGPLLAVVAGFLVSLGTLNMFIVYAIIVLGDVIGDSIFYLLGRSGHSFLAKHGHFIGATPERLATTREYFDNHHTKAITASKLIHGIGVTGLITAGSLKSLLRPACWCHSPRQQYSLLSASSLVTHTTRSGIILVSSRNGESS